MSDTVEYVNLTDPQSLDTLSRALENPTEVGAPSKLKMEREPPSGGLVVLRHDDLLVAFSTRDSVTRISIYRSMIGFSVESQDAKDLMTHVLTIGQMIGAFSYKGVVKSLWF